MSEQKYKGISRMALKDVDIKYDADICPLYVGNTCNLIAKIKADEREKVLHEIQNEYLLIKPTDIKTIKEEGIKEFVNLLKHDSSTWNSNLNTWEHCYTDSQLDELAERISE